MYVEKMLNLYLVSGLITIFFSFSNGSPYKLTNGLTVCRRSGPDLKECLNNAIKNGILLLKNGSKEFGLYSLDPLNIEELVMEQGRSHESFRLNMKFKNATFQNHSDISITVTKVNLENLSFKVKTYSPFSRLSGQYEMKGQMILLPVRGSGKVDMEFKGLSATLQMSLEPVKKSGNIYLKPKEVSYRLKSFENVKVNFQNLFKGNKALSDTINKALNDNWQGIVEVFKPSIDTFFSMFMSDIIGRVFGHIPYDQILPP